MYQLNNEIQNLDVTIPVPQLPETKLYWGCLEQVTLSEVPTRLLLAFGKDAYTIGNQNFCDLRISSEQLQPIVIIVGQAFSGDGDDCPFINYIGTPGQVTLDGETLVPNRMYVLKCNNKIVIGNGSDRQTLHFKYFEEVIDQKYYKGRSLTEGGFGQVYECQLNDYPKRALVIKEILKAKKPHKKNLETYITREVEILKCINHPFLVKLLDSVLNESGVQFVFDKAPFGDLDDYLKSGKRPILDNKKLARLTYQLSSGIKYLNEQNIIHRDIKPENVLIFANNPLHVVLTDFGLARFTAEDGEALSRLGTKSYAPPEILNHNGDKVYTYKVDIWSLGMLLFFSTTGIKPFGGDELKRIDATDVPPIFQYKQFKLVSYLAQNMIQSCLSHDPESRPSAQELMNHTYFDEHPDVVEYCNLLIQKFQI